MRRLGCLLRSAPFAKACWNPTVPICNVPPKLCSMFRGARQASAPRRIRGRRCGMKMLVTASWLSFGTGIYSPLPTTKLIRDHRHKCSLLHVYLQHIEANGGKSGQGCLTKSRKRTVPHRRLEVSAATDRARRRPRGAAAWPSVVWYSRPRHWPCRSYFSFTGLRRAWRAHRDVIAQLTRLLCRARALEGEITDLVAATGFNRQYPTRYVIIHLVVLLQIELRVLTKRGLDTPPA
jgi:hypothetical protein